MKKENPHPQPASTPGAAGKNQPQEQSAPLEGHAKEVKDLSHALEQSRATITQYTDQLKRLQAEFENYIKRNKREMEEFKLRSTEQLLLKLVDVHEDLARAVSLLRGSTTDGAVQEGITLVEKNLHKILLGEGIVAIESQGKKFDPHLHEVLLFEINNKVHEGTIVQDLQRGYMIHGRVLRPAKVKITKHPAASTGPAESKTNIK